MKPPKGCKGLHKAPLLQGALGRPYFRGLCEVSQEPQGTLQSSSASRGFMKSLFQGALQAPRSLHKSQFFLRDTGRYFIKTPWAFNLSSFGFYMALLSEISQNS